jgi:hypothetical protein
VGGYGWKIGGDGRVLALLRPLEDGPCLQHSGVLSRIGTRPLRRSAAAFARIGRSYSPERLYRNSHSKFSRRWVFGGLSSS